MGLPAGLDNLVLYARRLKAKYRPCALKAVQLSNGELDVKALAENLVLTELGDGGMGMLEKLIELATAEYDGHFSLLKFSSNWSCCFGTITDGYEDIEQMSVRKTMDEAIDRCIQTGCNVFAFSYGGEAE